MGYLRSWHSAEVLYMRIGRRVSHTQQLCNCWHSSAAKKTFFFWAL